VSNLFVYDAGAKKLSWKGHIEKRDAEVQRVLFTGFVLGIVLGIKKLRKKNGSGKTS